MAAAGVEGAEPRPPPAPPRGCAGPGPPHSARWEPPAGFVPVNSAAQGPSTLTSTFTEELMISSAFKATVTYLLVMPLCHVPVHSILFGLKKPA